MDRKDQLRNVAFGGAWSEQIAGREELAGSLQRLRDAAGQAGRFDVRTDAEVTVALWKACKDHPKGEMLQQAWGRGAALANPGLRVRELQRIAALLEEGHRGSPDPCRAG